MSESRLERIMRLVKVGQCVRSDEFINLDVVGRPSWENRTGLNKAIIFKRVDGDLRFWKYMVSKGTFVRIGDRLAKLLELALWPHVD